MTDHTLAALRIIREVLVGLEYAHNRGEIHADISPDNILVHQKEAGLPAEVTIIDWGLGRTYAEREPGCILGKARYMAPEQAMGEDLDGRVDIYSIGVVLFEALTGAKALGDARNISDAIYRRIHGEAFNMPTLQRHLSLLDEGLRLEITNFMLRLTALSLTSTEESGGPTRYGSAYEARLAVEGILERIGADYS